MLTRDELTAALAAAVDRVDAEAATRSAFTIEDDTAYVGEHVVARRGECPFVVAIGKAAAAMVRGVAGAVGAIDGLAVSDHREPCAVELIESDHPIPSLRSITAGERVLDEVSSLAPDRPVIFCISGGGSALIEAPVDGVTLADIQTLNRSVIAGGLPIEDINEIRAAVSRLKGGGLSRACSSDRQTTVIVSDVIGAGPDHVASGPSIGHRLGARAADVITASGLATGLPESIVRAANEWRPNRATVGDAAVVVASAEHAALGARDALGGTGIPATVLDEPLTGLADQAVRWMLDGLQGSDVRIAVGEVTVRVLGAGPAAGTSTVHSSRRVRLLERTSSSPRSVPMAEMARPMPPERSSTGERFVGWKPAGSTSTLRSHPSIPTRRSEPRATSSSPDQPAPTSPMCGLWGEGRSRLRRLAGPWLSVFGFRLSVEEGCGRALYRTGDR